MKPPGSYCGHVSDVMASTVMEFRRGKVKFDTKQCNRTWDALQPSPIDNILTMSVCFSADFSRFPAITELIVGRVAVPRKH